MIRDYVQASEYLGSKVDRPLPGRATRIQRRDDHTIAVCYQGTDVVSYTPPRIVLNSAGWRSITTKARMAEYTRAHIWSDRGTWYVGGQGHGIKAVLYQDFMAIRSDGTPIARPNQKRQAQTERKAARYRALVRRYVRGFAEVIKTGKLEDPGQGDCWGCYFTLSKPGEQAKKPDPTGRDSMTGIDHLVEHLKERYFVPSLLYKAITERGYRDPGFIWTLMKQTHDHYHATRALRAYFRLRQAAITEAL